MKKQTNFLPEKYFLPDYEGENFHCNVLLALAFNMAQKNIENNDRFFYKLFGTINDLLQKDLRLDDYNKIKKLIESQDHFLSETKKGLEKFISQLRNYHSHYFHDDSIVKHDDSIIKQDNDIYKTLFKNLYDKTAKPILKQAFLKNNKISYQGLLFIASFFLYKRQLKILLDHCNILYQKNSTGKNEENSEVDGKEKSLIQKIFLDNTLRENIAVFNFDYKMVFLRKLLSYIKEIPFDKEIKNAKIYDLAEEEINKIEDADKEYIFRPYRKNHNPTAYFADFLISMGYLKSTDKNCMKDVSIEVAVVKRRFDKSEDEKNYAFVPVEKYRKWLTEFETDDNFSDSRRRYYIKNGNLLLLLTSSDGYSLNVLVPKKFLMKWIYVIITEGKNAGCGIMKEIFHKLRGLRNKQSSDIDIKKDIYNVFKEAYGDKVSEILPKSIIEYQQSTKGDTKIAVENSINQKIDELENFREANRRLGYKAKKSFSRKKILTVLRFLLLELKFQLVQQQNEDKQQNEDNLKDNLIDKLRHEYFKKDEYNTFYQYLRHYTAIKKYKSNRKDKSNKGETSFREIEKKSIDILKKKEMLSKIFEQLESKIKRDPSLENLFTNAIDKYIDRLKELKDNTSFTPQQKAFIIRKHLPENNMQQDKTEYDYLKTFVLNELLFSATGIENTGYSKMREKLSGNNALQINIPHFLLEKYLEKAGRDTLKKKNKKAFNKLLEYRLEYLIFLQMIHFLSEKMTNYTLNFDIEPDEKVPWKILNSLFSQNINIQYKEHGKEIIIRTPLKYIAGKYHNINKEWFREYLKNYGKKGTIDFNKVADNIYNILKLEMDLAQAILQLEEILYKCYPEKFRQYQNGNKEKKSYLSFTDIINILKSENEETGNRLSQLKDIRNGTMHLHILSKDNLEKGKKLIEEIINDLQKENCFEELAIENKKLFAHFDSINKTLEKLREKIAAIQ